MGNSGLPSQGKNRRFKEVAKALSYGFSGLFHKWHNLCVQSQISGLELRGGLSRKNSRSRQKEQMLRRCNQFYELNP